MQNVRWQPPLEIPVLRKRLSLELSLAMMPVIPKSSLFFLPSCLIASVGSAGYSRDSRVRPLRPTALVVKDPARKPSARWHFLTCKATLRFPGSRPLGSHRRCSSRADDKVYPSFIG